MTKVCKFSVTVRPLDAFRQTARVVLTVAAVAFGTSAAHASTIMVSSPYSATQVASAMAAASNGDTVLMPPSGGPFSWTSAVTLSSSKCLTLDLNGREIALSGASGTIAVQAHASCLNRLTNGTITKSGTGYADYNGPVQILDSVGRFAVRVDHIECLLGRVTGINHMIHRIDLHKGGERWIAPKFR